MRRLLWKVIAGSSERAMTRTSRSEIVGHMISPHAHISMTYQPPAPELKHVHRIEKPKAEKPMKRRSSVAQRLHLVPRHA